MWKTNFSLEETFFSEFDNPKIIDLPGFSYEKEQHERERELMKEFFEEAEEERRKKRSERSTTSLHSNITEK